MAQRKIRAIYMRGGTSKGVFFHADSLPADQAVRDRILLRVIGSPDPYGQQTDGLGGATSSTSKVVLVGPSLRGMTATSTIGLGKSQSTSLSSTGPATAGTSRLRSARLLSRRALSTRHATASRSCAFGRRTSRRKSLPMCRCKMAQCSKKAASNSMAWLFPLPKSRSSF